jgi:hypothetical protein
MRSKKLIIATTAVLQLLSPWKTLSNLLIIKEKIYVA